MRNIAPRRSVGRNNSRLLGIFVEEVDEDNIPDDVNLLPGQKLWKCALEGCIQTMKSKQMQTSRWYEHLVCKCNGDGLNDAKRLRLANLSQEKNVVDWKIQYLSRKADRQQQLRTIENNEYRLDVPNDDIPQDNSQRLLTQATLNSVEFADNCDENRAEKITAAISEFLVYNALSFNLVESDAFKKMLTALNCAYKPPKRDAFRTIHLDNLYESTSKYMDDKWRLLGNPMKTLGFDGYTDNNGNSVVNVTVSALGVSACEDSIDPGTEIEDAEFLSRTVLTALEKNGDDVEAKYAGVVCDNTSANMNSLTIVKARYPKLIGCGCISHVSDLLIEDLFKMGEFKKTLNKVKTVATFVRSHRRVKNLYKTLCKTPRIGSDKKGTMLKLFPDTRFSYGDLMIQQYIQNKYFLEAMCLTECGFDTICNRIGKSKVTVFKDIVTPVFASENRNLDAKAELIHQLTGLVCKMIHHVEQKKCKASWINALFFALMKDFDDWCNDYQVIRTFDTDEIQEINGVLINRWNGCRVNAKGHEVNIIPFKSDIWTAAAMFDPYYTPTHEKYISFVSGDLVNYVASISSLIKPYLDEDQLDDQQLKMEEEVNYMVMRRGKWGDLIKKFQRSLPEPPVILTSYVEKEIFRQNSMRPVRSFWETTGKFELPLCADLALRLSIVSVQSADVERMCKAHNIIHTKSRNRLQHERVKKLLYCYINLRITKDERSEADDFLLSIQDDDDDDAVDEEDEGAAEDIVVIDDIDMDQDSNSFLLEDGSVN